MNKRILRTATAVLALVACTAPAQSDPNLLPNFEITPKGQRGWKPTKMKLAELGKRMDVAMRGLKYTAHQALVLYEEGSTRKTGRMITTSRIQNASMFSIEFPDFTAKPPTPIEVRSDGKFVAMQTNAGGWSAKGRLPTKTVAAPPAANLVNAWPTSFPKMMYSNLILKADIWSALMKGFASGAGGFQTFIEERQMKDSTGVLRRSYRVVARRPANAAKKQTAAAIQIVVDAKRFLPVTLMSNYLPAGAKVHTRMQWQGGWTLPNIKHATKWFDLP